jgi:hypothetical protein
MSEHKVTFPMLNDVEIVECFKELGVQSLTVQNLTKPEPEFIYALYENVVQKLMGITAEEMAKPVFEPYNEFAHPQLYDGAIYQLTFLENLYVSFLFPILSSYLGFSAVAMLRCAQFDFQLFSPFIAPHLMGFPINK